MQRRKVQGSTWGLIALLVSWLCVTLSSAQETPDSAKTWRVWLDPRFMRAPVIESVPGAEKTVLTAGELKDGELRPWTKEEFNEAVGGSWQAFAAKAGQNAAMELAGLKPEYSRDRQKVIEYAVIRSDRPIVASAVLAAGFSKMFEETLGPKVYLVVPSRYVAIIFPALASNYRDYAPLVFREYRASAFPVSVEVFEVSADGIKAIGAYQEP